MGTRLTSFFIATTFAIAIMSGCAKTPKPLPFAKKQEMKLTYTDPAEAQKADEVTSPEIISTTSSSQETAKTAADGSEVRTMYDGFGNKTDTRSFWGNDLVQRLIVRTSKDGQKTGFVYGQNGDVRSVPAAAINNMMTMTADALAKTVGITEGKRVEAKPVEDPELTTAATLVSDGPVYMRPVLPEQEDERPQTAKAATTAPVEMPNIADDLRRKVQIPIARKTPVAQ